MTEKQLALPIAAPTQCPVCHARDPKNCRHNHDLRHDAIPWATPRPRGCLASAQNREGIPF